MSKQLTYRIKKTTSIQLKIFFAYWRCYYLKFSKCQIFKNNIMRIAAHVDYVSHRVASRPYLTGVQYFLHNFQCPAPGLATSRILVHTHYVRIYKKKYMVTEISFNVLTIVYCLYYGIDLFFSSNHKNMLL